MEVGSVPSRARPPPPRPPPARGPHAGRGRRGQGHAMATAIVTRHGGRLAAAPTCVARHDAAEARGVSCHAGSSRASWRRHLRLCGALTAPVAGGLADLQKCALRRPRGGRARLSTWDVKKRARFGPVWSDARFCRSQARRPTAGREVKTANSRSRDQTAPVCVTGASLMLLAEAQSSGSARCPGP